MPQFDFLSYLLIINLILLLYIFFYIFYIFCTQFLYKKIINQKKVLIINKINSLLINYYLNFFKKINLLVLHYKIYNFFKVYFFLIKSFILKCELCHFQLKNDYKF